MVSNVRRQRGYSWEARIIEEFRLRTKWWALRLGGTTVNWPDIVATYNHSDHDKEKLITIECKSSTGDSITVPAEQIRRCYGIMSMFGAYRSQHIVLAFKFSKKRRLKKKGEFEGRKERKYYVWIAFPQVVVGDPLEDFKCNYYGVLQHNQSSRIVRMFNSFNDVMNHIESIDTVSLLNNRASLWGPTSC